MRVDPLTLETLWAGALRDLPFRKASFFVTSLLAPGLFWLFGAALAGATKPISLLGLVGLAGLSALGLGSSLVQVRWRSRRTGGWPSSRTVVSVHQAYYSCMILLLSAYSMILAVQVARRVGWPFHNIAVVLYALSAIAGVLWAPRSLPSKPQDVALAASRGVRWLPWVIAIQAGLTSLGVLLGVWASRGDGSWAYFLVLGLGTLLALITVTLGFSAFYRFLVFVTNPPPA